MEAAVRRSLEALAEKHEGELVELDAEWTEGKGEIPDILFHPQFASNDEDYKFGMRNGWGKSSWKSKYDNDREILKKLERRACQMAAQASQPLASQPLAAEASLFWQEGSHSNQTSCS